MHVRRALLLFAIVLLLAALAATISAPPREREPAAPPSPPAREDPPRRADGGREQLSFSSAGEPRTRRLPAGASARVTVAVEEPGQVAIPRLGLTTTALPGTPAIFPLLVSRPGSYEVRLRPASGAPERRVGTIAVRRPPRED